MKKEILALYHNRNLKQLLWIAVSFINAFTNHDD